MPDTILYAGRSIVVYIDRSHIALRELLKISKDNMGWGQNLLIVANICWMEPRREMADMLLVSFNYHGSLI